MQRVKSVLSASAIFSFFSWFQPIFGRCAIWILLFSTELKTALFLVVRVNGVSFDSSQFFGKLIEEHFDVLAGLCRCFKKQKVHPLSVLLTLFKRNLTALVHV